MTVSSHTNGENLIFIIFKALILIHEDSKILINFDFLLFMYNSDNLPDHSYEEVRKAAIDVLARRWKTNVPEVFKVPDNYDYFKEAVGNLLNTKDARYSGLSDEDVISQVDSDTFLEVFWDLFRQGIITLGSSDKKREFPSFRLSAHGKKIIESKDLYFFHDVSSYETVIKEQVPNIDEVTLLYLREAMQTFYCECYLSSSVMLGVASEHTFLTLLETISKSTYSSTFEKAIKSKTISQKFGYFKNKLKQEIGENKITLPYEITETLDSHLEGIMNAIRRFRNDAGHPSGKVISRELCFSNLTLFILYCKTTYQLMDYFANAKR